MKRTYIVPEMTVVKLQSQNALLQASIQSFSSNLMGTDVISYGGDSSNDTSGQGIRTKESVNIWDEEW